MISKLIIIIRDNKKSLGIFLIMITLLTVSLLSFYPGIITIDGTNQWNQIKSNNIIKNHPFFSTFFWWLLSKVWFSPTSLIIFQIVLISIIWTRICKNMSNNKNYKIQLLYTVFLCFLPIIFGFAVTTWKDIIYSYNLLILGLMLYVGINKDFNYSYIDIFIICISLVWINNFRYNGIIVLILSLITFSIIFKIKKIKFKKIIISLLIFISIFTTCKIPEIIMCKEKNNASGNDIVFFVLASLINSDKIQNQEDLEIINKFYPIEKVKENYDPYVINPLVFSKDYNREKYNENYKDIIKILFANGIRHPFTIAKHYINIDNMLISPVLKDGLCYLYIFEFREWYSKYTGNFDTVVNPIFEAGYTFYLKIINASLSTKFLQTLYMPSNALYISIILMIFYCKKMKDKRYFLVLLPAIFNTISLLPINVAQDLRYAYINHLTLLMIIIPILIFNEKSIIYNFKRKRKDDTVKKA